MKILVMNCGSSSLKYQLINMENEEVLAIGLAERIGIAGARVKHEASGKEKVTIEQPMENHKTAIKIVLEALIDENYGAIKSMDEIAAVGHRVVHGGERFSSSVVVTDDVKNALEECSDLAPLHNPPNLMGIEACQEILPNVPMVGVFDTAFHQTMPESSYMYALPYELYEKHKIRRYGFHGTSHKYVAMKAAEILERPIEDLKIIACHLGNGASITAVDGGISVDTSMGFTPLEGLVMGTRCGDMDPAIVTFLMEKEKIDHNQVNAIMNKQSGVYGLSGVSSDFRDIEVAVKEGNKRAQLALDVYYKRVKKYIGAYAAEMGGVDAVVFTAGLGENSPETRKSICEGLEFLGIKIDNTKNNVRGKETVVSTDDTPTKVLLIPTNEELAIARETKSLI
ncbi:acetate kinase [Alkaliphilus metalliredigens QYMF]|uniref:Acetate kinase n=1 Tax=Alkaliphilus metalliredigens (strain QYMF) TaxID=293826 RepID=ACKA_ALKMQ|nr:acetate kinase [Alkaliphilus metalliredigens]A6TRU6.1 RecName: Full=Acetate kinase; AltName: Full=Acetokinase [Alkaliphilus metalliredigens QYMF]ABR48914.1 acetate kinase [Alkaliphilus metalliredigens QYMF]